MARTDQAVWPEKAVDNLGLRGRIQGTEHIVQNKDFPFQSHGPRDGLVGEIELVRKPHQLLSITQGSVGALTSRWR